MKKIILIAAAALVSLSASAQKFAHVNFNELDNAYACAGFC